MELNINGCTGCSACYSICPNNSIVMHNDREGVLHPKIDKKSCINCRMCEKICPVLSNDKKNDFEKIAYACYTKDEDIRLKSSSGGIFTELARFVLKQGGVVFGAAFSDDFTSVRHIAVNNVDDLQKLRGSKYVQSDIGDTYKEAKRYLSENRLVLFTGTPCQIAGLNSFLIKKYDNLITQDLICHGVPSPLVWRKYVEYQESKSNSDIKSISFRNKDNGWKGFKVLFEFKNNAAYLQTFSDDIYMQGFLKNYYLRESCYSCQFKNGKGTSDITLADFWGIENVFPEMDDDKGTSLVIVNSEKGQKLFGQISGNIVLKKTSVEIIKRYNPAYNRSVEFPSERKRVLKCIERYGISEGIARGLKPTMTRRIAGKIKLILSR